MFEYLRTSRYIIRLTTFLFVFVLFQPTAQAVMVSTNQLAADHQSQLNRQQLLSSLERQEVQAALEQYGVDVAMAKKRVAALSDEEVSALNRKIEEIPAGSGVVGAIVLIFLVLLVT
ncbi:MAG: PA2779 family protein, partial [Gammaproteobacteria bacterium]|nr:PA2779 family protein [Gammaproteobacteria bacterium]